MDFHSEYLRVLQQLMGRIDGPLHLRLIVQSLVATVLAVRAAHRDATLQNPPFLWALIMRKHERRALFLSAWKDIGKLFTMAFVIDTGYQVFFLHFFYPLQGLMVASILALVPYVLIRGPLARLSWFQNFVKR